VLLGAALPVKSVPMKLPAMMLFELPESLIASLVKRLNTKPRTVLPPAVMLSVKPSPGAIAPLSSMSGGPE
jgi:hypothetical protein